ncbi:MAG TPA: CHAT domain-containing tetratricopeptide repeat protein, partial [Candidatus Angelobacter sp.]|nr:CHAT domain-containing tetratricopeptide repeat protein [Candidatus Angelobacter sp.]
AVDDTVRLARLDINFGNIFHRQDRFSEALDCYQRAYSQLAPDKDAEGIIAALHNVAVCLIALNENERAQETYENVRKFAQKQDMPLAVAQADYNIASLYFFRGEYGRAIEILRAACNASLQTGDVYHAALCLLDLSEIYLQLNLNQDAADLAGEAFQRFEELGTGYEAAKALTHSAIALSQQRKNFQALMLFAQARAMFVKEKNHVWPALIDLYEAFAHFNDGRAAESRRYCAAALDFFRNSALPGRAVLCRLLLARLSLNAGDVSSASQECGLAFRDLEKREAPVLLYQAHLVMGRIEETIGNLEEAEKHYCVAKDVLERLRGGIRGEELKISFLENRIEVYENLAGLYLSKALMPNALQEAWHCMELAKSRNLLEMIVRSSSHPHLHTPGKNALTPYALKLREQLNWYYHRIDAEQTMRFPARNERLLRLRDQAGQSEKEFLRFMREIPSDEAEAAGLEPVKPASLESVRESLCPATTLIEYFRVQDSILATVITRDNLEIVPVTSASQVIETLRMLQLQFSLFRLSPEHVKDFVELLLPATKARLSDLYTQLIAPIRNKLQGKYLLVVPHESLHCVPFHALFDGENYLIDSYAISYAPSASIYVQCRQKQAKQAGHSLVLGVADPQAPHIDEELRSVAALLPEAKLFVGSQASEKVLQEYGAGSQLVHIATHGFFRQDRPMFSGIRLGDTFLTLYDLYRLKLPVEHITISGCSTGMNAVAAGDEIIGLIRGLLFAGARSLLLSLWDVNDGTTADLMRSFYGHYLNRKNRALALQDAMKELRVRYPHPYYWAPFMLVGNAAA